MTDKDPKKKSRMPFNRDKDSKEPNTLKGTGRSLLFWLGLLMVMLIVYTYFDSFSNRDTAQITYSEFTTQIESGNITEVTFTDRELEGRLLAPTVFESTNTTTSYSRFRSRIPFADINYQVVSRLEEANIKIIVKQEDRYFSILISVLPWVFLVLIWLFFIRQMQGGGGPKGLFSFGKSKAKLLTDDRPNVNFGDVAGADEAKEELQEIIEFLTDPGKFQKLGGKIPKGALLLGAPGTGKTLLARAVAGEASVPFFSMSGSDFVEMFVGVGASRVRDLFEQGKKNAPCIIFIDEIDAVGRHRGAGLGGGHDEREQTLNQLLVEMDGFESNDGVILIAATNRPDVLDPALLRPGRFDRQIMVGMPDIKGREGILKVHVKKVKLADDVDLKILARGTPGMSGADLAKMVNEAALLAAREDLNEVTMESFEKAKDKVLMGSERRSLVITPEEKEMIAYHEGGHALVSRFLPGCDPIHKVTIIPRGRALGLTVQLPVDERHTHSGKYLENMLVVMMGGRVAEQIIFNQVTTGASNDLERATKLARKMVCNWGMSETLGPVTFGRSDEHIFLGREMAQSKDYSEETAMAIDREIRVFIEAAEKMAFDILSEHKNKLTMLAKALLEKEIIDGPELDRIIGLDQDPEKVETPAPSPSGE